jgi:hypothetical protein
VLVEADTAVPLFQRAAFSAIEALNAAALAVMMRAAAAA